MIVDERVLKAKSVHIYAWPFQVRQEASREAVRESIKKRGWKRKNWERLNPNDFMLRQYLTSSLRDVFLNEKENAICEVYELPVEGDLKYVINDYELEITGLELHFYHYGAGILFIQTANGQYTDIEDIRKINDLGRRICLPFLPSEENPYILCAEKLGIKNMPGDESVRYITCFREAINTWLFSPGDMTPAVEEILTEPVNFLFLLLGCTKEQVEMTSDDRMFSVGLLRDTSLSQRIIDGYGQEDEELGILLYQLIYTDPETCTCQNESMREALLEKAVYDRWSDYGTIHGITNYSMICLTTEDKAIEDSVVRPFIAEYTYLISLVLMQKIGIAFFSELAGRIVEGVDQEGMITRKQAKTLINLQERYITFKNQLIVLEATCQEQGTEIYKLMQKQLQIHEEQTILDDQLESLYEVTNVSSGRRIESWGLGLAIGTIVLDLIVSVLS